MLRTRKELRIARRILLLHPSIADNTTARPKCRATVTLNGQWREILIGNFSEFLQRYLNWKPTPRRLENLFDGIFIILLCLFLIDHPFKKAVTRPGLDVWSKSQVVKAPEATTPRCLQQWEAFLTFPTVDSRALMTQRSHDSTWLLALENFYSL